MQFFSALLTSMDPTNQRNSSTLQRRSPLEQRLLLYLWCWCSLYYWFSWSFLLMLDVDTSLKVIRSQLKTEHNMIVHLSSLSAVVRMDNCNKTMWCTKFQFVVTIYLNLHKKNHQAKHRAGTLCWFKYPKYTLNSDIEVFMISCWRLMQGSVLWSENWHS